MRNAFSFRRIASPWAILFAAALLFALSAAVGMSSSPPTPSAWTIHEWGTFTVLQDDRGQGLGGINVDDEPVPRFVHELNRDVLGSPHGIPSYYMKGTPQRHPFVTMRLETPVIYFHPPRPLNKPVVLDVDVAMHGGWLTQFYPNADVDAPGLKNGSFGFGPITGDTVGRLSWRGLVIGGSSPGPATNEPVWTTPRRVQAAEVTAAGELEEGKQEDESERFLFYRGVANLNAPLAVVAQRPGDRLEIRGQFADVLKPGESLKVGPLWLVHIRSGGSVAFRRVEPLTVTADRQRTVGLIDAALAEKEFAPENLDRLRRELHDALVADGLFADEATALIDTWNRSYFQSPGLRLFFLVPQRWTDHYLPLTVSPPAEIRRVMIGRIELVSPEQRKLLARLAAMPVSDGKWMAKITNNNNRNKFFAGRSDFGDLGVRIPDDYQAYLDLGRFRNALLIEQQRLRPTPSLARFIATYDLKPFEPPAK